MSVLSLPCFGYCPHTPTPPYTRRTAQVSLRWTALNPLPAAGGLPPVRNNFAAAALRDWIFVFGGKGPTIPASSPKGLALYARPFRPPTDPIFTSSFRHQA